MACIWKVVGVGSSPTDPRWGIFGEED